MGVGGGIDGFIVFFIYMYMLVMVYFQCNRLEPTRGDTQINRHYFFIYLFTPQRGAADAEIKVPSSETKELKRSLFKAWSRSVYSRTCYAYCQGFLPCLFLPFRSIHPHFFPKYLRFFLCWLWLAHGSCVGSHNKMGHRT